MTDAEAEAALVALEQHFKQPVMPLSRFCTAITTWFRAIERANTDPDLMRPGGAQGRDYFNVLRRVERDIRKSNLLARLLWNKEVLRTTMCPTHKGRYHGDPCACQGTGWLPAAPKEAVV